MKGQESVLLSNPTFVMKRKGNMVSPKGGWVIVIGKSERSSNGINSLRVGDGMAGGGVWVWQVNHIKKIQICI